MGLKSLALGGLGGVAVQLRSPPDSQLPHVGVGSVRFASSLVYIFSYSSMEQ